MSLYQTVTTSFKVELLQAQHNFGPTSADTFKLALYTAAASLSDATTAYTTSGEVSGTGYDPGGVELDITVSPTYGTVSGITVAYIGFSNAVWSGASFTARGALIYNSSNANKSVAVLDFGADKTVVNQTFTVVMPTATANSAIIRIS